MDWISELSIFIVGAVLGSFSLFLYYRFQLGSYETMAATIVRKAEQDAEAHKRKAEAATKQHELEQQKELEHKLQQARKKIAREEERLQLREDKVEERHAQTERAQSDINRREQALQSQQGKVDELLQQNLQTQKQLLIQLEQCAGLTTKEAKEMIIEQISLEVKAETANLIRRISKEAEEEAEKNAKKILATAINRLSVPTVSEATVNTVAIPADDVKGRIIGREGRNIRALEHETGVNFMLDDTPGVVVISGYDPIRLHVAKMALTELISDGRIYPSRIEEVVEKAKQNVSKQITSFGEDAALRVGLMNLHPEIIKLLGKLKFRYSYGQNILEHSLEVCHLMGIMASELGLDGPLAKRIGLLHDMGKAVSHEMEGTHAVIGHDLALRYGETKEVANGIGCHHSEMDPITIEGSLCSAADAISASRPGARIEAVEEYIKRLKKLEDLAMTFPGVEKAYALQAGREIRVVVRPDHIDDGALLLMARDLTKTIEKELNYPGKIKVTAIRETRVIEYAM